MANENYFKGAPKIKEVVLRPLTNDATRTAALLSGEVDIIDDVPVLDTARIKADQKVEVVSRPGLRKTNLQMNQNREISPHAKAPTSVARTMALVMLALVPATRFGLYQFGWPAIFWINLPLGADGTEFGGADTGIPGVYLSSGPSASVQLVWYW